MASITIEKRKKANGEFSYRCKVRVKKNNLIIHSETKTFSKKELTSTWGKTRINEIETKGIKINKVVSLAEFLNMYFENYSLWSNTGRTIVKQHNKWGIKFKSDRNAN